MSNMKDEYNLDNEEFNSESFDDIDLDDLNDITDLDEDNISFESLSDMEPEYSESAGQGTQHRTNTEDEAVIRNDDASPNDHKEDGEEFLDDDFEDITHYSIDDLYDAPNDKNGDHIDDAFTPEDPPQAPRLEELQSQDSDDPEDEDELIDAENMVLPVEVDLLDEDPEENLEEDEYSIQDQLLYSAQSTASYVPPSGVNLIDKPVDSPDTVKDSPGTFNNAVKYFAITCVSAATLLLAGVGGVVFANSNKTNHDTVVAQNNTGSSQGGPNASSGSSNASNHSSLPPENVGGNPTSTSSVIVGEDSSRVTYKVTSHGDVEAASVSFMEGKGQARQQNGIGLPEWEQSVAIDNSAKPYIGVSWIGGGTVNCEIIKDGEAISKQGEPSELPQGGKTLSCQ